MPDSSRPAKFTRHTALRPNAGVRPRHGAGLFATARAVESLWACRRSPEPIVVDTTEGAVVLVAAPETGRQGRPQRRVGEVRSARRFSIRTRSSTG